MKGRAKFPRTKFGPPTAFLLCFLSFLAGFFFSNLLSQDVPGVRPGSRVLESVGNDGGGDLMPFGETGDSSFQVIPFQVLSWKPRALYFPGFATAEQCQSIIEMAKSNLMPSTLALRKGETDESTKGTRTSSGTFISASEDKTGILDAIEQKIARATMLPTTHGEAFNILRYNIGQKYDSHYDAFNPAEYGPQKSQRQMSMLASPSSFNCCKLIGFTLRGTEEASLAFCFFHQTLLHSIASFLLYLSDVDEGGETMFPFENGEKIDMGFDYRKCTGLKVKPRRGDGLLFYSVFPNGTIDQLSLHGSCPVIKGEKWVATKWIRDQVEED
ncbi:probable prolyl 4-hydroxylase 9 isoform X1 [Morus notabilis]|uniref:probable prolyl 4-hydroxylase 9 isoform X1 n=2 Tax=Morus notabilis TaxID=981085 RepID=UPI000CED2B15|nr:probable prolyl 4-hydroxylase 9 isoform X1 [Morus notabilis]